MERGRRARRGGRSIAKDVDAADRRLLKMLDRTFDEARRRAGDWLVCRPGCFECCVGPFPITALDVRRLRRGLERLQAHDAQRAAAVRDRAVAARAAMRDGFPGDPSDGLLTGDEAAEARFAERHASLPCPALDPQTGCCELYDHRPVSCRTYGPPVRFGGEAAAPCRLCFDGAPPEEIERCRVEPDRDDREGALLRSMGDDGSQTFIPFALR